MTSRGILQILDVGSVLAHYPWTYPISFKVERPGLKLKFFAVPKPSIFIRVIWNLTIFAYVTVNISFVGLFISEINLKATTFSPIQVIILCLCFGATSCMTGPFFFTLYRIRNADYFNGILTLERRLQKQPKLGFKCKCTQIHFC